MSETEITATTLLLTGLAWRVLHGTDAIREISIRIEENGTVVTTVISFAAPPVAETFPGGEA